MLSVQPVTLAASDEKLTTICPGTTVCLNEMQVNETKIYKYIFINITLSGHIRVNCILNQSIKQLPGTKSSCF